MIESSNFAFLRPRWDRIADLAEQAEVEAPTDPYAACRRARIALESAMHWMAVNRMGDRHPAKRRLEAHIECIAKAPWVDATGREALGEPALFVREWGNYASHPNPPTCTPQLATEVVASLHKVLVWFASTHLPDDPAFPDYDVSRRLRRRSSVTLPEYISGQFYSLYRQNVVSWDGLIQIVDNDQNDPSLRGEVAAILLTELTGWLADLQARHFSSR